MSDSKLRDELDAEQARNREQRIGAIKRWVAYIEANPPEVWGPQLNDLVDSQLKSARALDLDPEHYRRIERAGRHIER